MLTKKENREKDCADENISKRIFIMMTARRLRRAVSVASVKTKKHTKNQNIWRATVWNMGQAQPSKMKKTLSEATGRIEP